MGKSVKWPTGLGAKGNEGVSGLVKQTKGSVGYCELAYALHNNLPQAHLKNKKGNFIKPEIASISQAANVDIPAHTRVSLTDTDAEKGYPVAGFTWILLYQEQSYDGRSKGKVKTMIDLLWWMIYDGQKYCEPLDYAPLPKAAVAKAETIIKSVTYGGKAIKK
jgi:phosphate transport system substrate-binding protein